MEPTQTDSKTGPPAATVIVPVYNARASLEQCLSALSRSEGADFDVVVVDDGSTEPLESLVTRFGCRYVRIDGPGGPARARNRGVEQVASELVIFVDADICVHPDTVARLVGAFEHDGELAAVFGSYDDEPMDPGFLSRYRNLLHHYTHCRSAGPVPTFWSGCGAIRRELFLRYGGFDEQRYRRPAIEDIELGTWMTAGGCRIVLDPSIQCKHLKRWSPGNMVKTDVLERGAPWIDLMLRSRKAVRTLNVDRVQQLSVGLVLAACALTVLSLLQPCLLIGVAGALLSATRLNTDFYRFLASGRGLRFAVLCVPLHWLYFVCCGVSVPIGVLKHWRSGFLSHEF